MKNILVTGGAGFIGSNYIHYMLEKHNHSIVNLDALTYAGNLENLSQVEGDHRYTFIKGDITDRELVAQIFDQYTIHQVIHFAAESHVDRSIKSPEIFIKTNILGTQVLLEVAKEKWQIGSDQEGYPIYKEGVKFLHISTDEVYGALGQCGYFLETSPIQPTSPYAASKASSDLLVLSYYKTYKLPINITRCSNNYGPYQYPEKLIPLMIGNGLKDKGLPIYGDGSQVRDWLHVLDHCRAVDMVRKKGKKGEIYNVGGNNEKTNLEIVTIILETLGKSKELIQNVADRLGHDTRYALDHTKITKELGWQPTLTFEQGIKATIQWYIEHPERLE